MTDALKRLADAGVAVWLDDLSRKRITSGNLAELIDESHV
ncbi:transaldolase, partial [Streptomyces sp. MCAF7]